MPAAAVFRPTVTRNTHGSQPCADDCLLGTCQPPAELCANGVDDDGDGRIDLWDSDCPWARTCPQTLPIP
jgi:hypothetical protein